MKLRILFSSILLLFIYIAGQSQHLTDFISRDTMVYVYQLDKQQTNYILQKNKIEDTAFLFTHLYKTIPVTKYRDDTLTYGNFLITTINQYNINYRYIYRSSIHIKSRVVGDDVIIFLSDKKNKANIEKAKVEIDKMPMLFNDGYGGYVINKNKINQQRINSGEVLLCISYGEEYTAMRYNFNSGYRAPEVPPTYHDGNYRGISEGYIITDKPVYKPGDTLNIKAFLMYPKNGKAIRRKATFTINEPAQNFMFTKRIKPVSPGAYVIQWAIPDTLKIDRNFNLNLAFKKSGITFDRASRFYLEDYVLNKNKYDVSLSNSLYFAGDDITFYVTATDANQFPIQGTQIHYKLSILNIQDFLVDSLRLTSAQRANWYEKDTVYSYDNFMTLKIPANILPKINADYILEVTLVDPITFERKVFTKQFTKQSDKEKVIIYQQEDSVHIHCLYNLKDTARPYQIISMSNQDTLFKRNITTPYSFKLSPYNTKVIFIAKDSTTTAVNISFSKLDITKVSGQRSSDSMKISFAFPFDEPVYYRISKGNKLIQSGKSRKLQFAVRDESKDPYTILLTTNLNGTIEDNYYRITYVPNEHQIKLTSNIPQQAFPGQKIPIEITATDYKNKPLRKVNIAAFAVNKQFEERLTVPQIVVPEKYNDLVEVKLQEILDHITLSMPSFNQNFTIKTSHLAKYNLLKNEYYAIRYPRKGMAIISSKIQSNVPEFAVTVTLNHQIYKPKYILLDGKPIFISDLEKDVYSFQAKAGVHEITVRYFDKKYILKNIQFEPGKKYWLGLNADSLTKSNSNVIVKDSMTAMQPNDEEKKLLYNSLLLTNQFTVGDSLTVQSNNNYSPGYTYYYGSYPQSLNIDGEYFYAFGPLMPNSDAILKIGSKNHPLKVSSEYAHYYDPFTNEFTSKKIGAVKGIIFGFVEKPIQDNDLSSLVVDDTAVFVPEQTPLEYHQQVYEYQQKDPELTYSQSYRNNNSNSQYFIIIVKNIDKNIFAKSLWIINNSRPEQSDFIPNVQRTNNFTYHKYGTEGEYDLYFLMNNNKLLCLKNIQFNSVDHFYINPSLFKLEKLVSDKLTTPLKFYTDLTSVPLLPFYFPPNESASQLKEIKNSHRINPYLHGVISTTSMQPISEALIYLEVNGVFKMGGYTNERGEFEILDIPAGSYQIKVYHPLYQIQHYNTRFLQQGNDYELNVSMHSSDISKPVYETVNRDFRFLCFGNSKQQNIFKVMLYDKESRETLKGANISFYLKDTLVDSKFFNSDNEIEIPFPVSQHLLYDIQINRNGYIPIRLHNVRFVKNLFYTIHMFMTQQGDKKLIRKKEYDLAMHLVNIAESEEQEYSASNASIEYTTNTSKSSNEISGKVKDEKGNSVQFASVVAIMGGIVKGGTKTDANGNFKIKPLTGGTYELHITYIGYEKSNVTGININKERNAKVIVQLKKSLSKSLNEVTIKSYKSNLISANEPGSRSVSVDQYSYNASAAPPYPNSNVSMSANFSRSVENSVININGARTSNTMYMIDGMMIRPGRGVSYEGGTLDRLDGMSGKYGNASGGISSLYADDDMIQQVANNKDISQSRKKFSDAGYWQPNHLTDKKGKVNFDIQLPDNITTWKSTILAMGKHRLHGIDSSETKVYKPLQTISLIPQFIWDNDKVYAKAKFSNLTKDAKKVKISIQLNDQVMINKETSIQHDYVDSVLLTSSNTKPIQWKAGLQLGENYKDEEVHEIPVFSSAFKSYNNQSFMMAKDSTYKLKFANDTKGTIMLNNTLYEKIVAQINELSNYEYGCVEQTASKLKALLCKEKINKMMGLKENLTPAIYNLINRLENFQNTDGTWGWWKKQSANWRMTIYVMDILRSANAAGYSNNQFSVAKDALVSNLFYLNKQDQVYGMFNLQKMGYFSQAMKEEFQQISLEDLRTIDKIYYYKVKQALGDTVKSTDLYALSLEMNQRLQIPYYEDFFNDPKSSMFTAYYLFDKTPIGKEILNLFKDKLTNGQLESNLNTYAKASMIEALTNNLEITGNKPISSVVTINDTLQIKTFPYILPIQGNSYRIQHTGGNVFLNTAEEYWTFKPNISDSLYSVTTSFLQHKKVVNDIEVGTPCQLKVTVKAFRSKEYVMLEIPIPSGMRVTNKIQQSGCTIEYYKHKIVVFYNKLSMDQHQLYFDMLPTLKGSFTMPAAKCSLMYYPHIYGNNETKTIEIK